MFNEVSSQLPWKLFNKEELLRTNPLSMPQELQAFQDSVTNDLNGLRTGLEMTFETMVNALAERDMI